MIRLRGLCLCPTMNPLYRFLSVLLLTPLLCPADAVQDAAIAKRLQPFVEEGVVSGIVTLVADESRILHLAALAKSDLGSGRPMKTDDLFWIASMTKPITAVCVQMLIEEGRFGLEDPVEKLLPEFRDQKLADGRSPVRAMTVRDLLTHKSGITEVHQMQDEMTLAELVAQYGKAPLRFEPGTQWAYSTAGINALGRIVEVVAGKPFEQFLQERLLDPLGMKDTTFWPTPEQAARLAKSYTLPKGQTQLQETEIGMIKGGVTNRKRPPTPGAGLFSTASDVARFYQMLLNEGRFEGRLLLKPASIKALVSPQTEIIPTPSAPGVTMGLGFKVQTLPQEVTAVQAPGTFGHGGAYGTQSWADPIHKRIYILLIQRSGMPKGDGSDLRGAFQESAFAAFGPPLPVAP
jgi:CubicO group peptidase (beta-lactamase class C family)